MSDSPLRVALADDDRLMRELLEQMLVNLGHEVVAMADNGQSLIDECVRTEPDVVITDNIMPDMCGLDAAAQIYKTRKVPIILFSGYCDRELVIDAEQKHVSVYLVKPVRQEHLEAALAQCRAHGSSLARDDAPVLVSSTGESAAEPPYRRHSRPPYQQTFRRPR
jgi:response regulator NasT